MAIACGVLTGLSLLLGPALLEDGTAWGQVPNPLQPLSGAAQETPAAEDESGEAEVNQSPVLEIQRELGNILPPSAAPQIERGAVRLDGRTQFVVGAPAPVRDAQGRLENRPIQERVRLIQRQLFDVASTEFDPETLNVRAVQEDGSWKIYVNADEFEGGQYLMTVTDADARVVGHSNIQDRAEELVEVIEESLIRYKQERQLEFLLRQVVIAIAILAAIGAGSWVIYRFQRRFKAERRRLVRQTRDLNQLGTTGPSDTGEPVVTTAIHLEMENQQRRTLLDIGRLVLWVGQVVLWVGGFFAIMGLFPYTRWFQPLLLQVAPVPLKLLALLWAMQVVIRLSDALIDRFFLVLQNRTILSPEATQRLALRFSTFSGVIKSVVGFMLGGVAVLIGLSMVGIEIAPLLAGAGIIGLGISFASQSLIKDVINGFFILLEDQYGVGDVVVIGDVSGFVETMNLRITQLRNEEGRLITIPNNAITVVQNLSKEWSRVDLMIDVAHTADLDEAIALTEKVAREMSQDAKWRPLILEPPLMLGVDRLDYRGVTIRMWIKTQPLKQWDVAREYRRRLKLAFDAAGIEIAVPQQMVSFQNTLTMRETFDGESSDRSSGSDGSSMLPYIRSEHS